MEEKLVRLVGGRPSVVTGYGGLHLGGDDCPLKQIDLVKHLAGDIHGISSGSFGDADRDGCLISSRSHRSSPAMENVLEWLLGPVLHFRDFLEIHRFSTARPDNDVSDLGARMEESARLHHDLGISFGEGSGDILPVPLLEHRDNTGRSKASAGQSCGVQKNTDLTVGTADDLGLTDEGYLTYRVLDLHGKAAEREVIVDLAMEGDCQDRHIVDGLHLDEWRTNAGWNPVKVGSELLGQAHEALVRIPANLKSCDQATFAGE